MQFLPLLLSVIYAPYGMAEPPAEVLVPSFKVCDDAVPEGRWFYTDSTENTNYRRTIPHSPDDGFWAPLLASPESQGMDSLKLDEAALALKLAAINARSLLVIRNDRLVKEVYFDGDDAGTSKNIHSSSKSILSAAVGVAIDKGLIRSHAPGELSPLDEKVAYYLPDYTVPPENQELTLRHLLTMTAGLQWEEDSSEDDLVGPKANWIESILSLHRIEPPGLHYHYSTANTHLISAILTNQLHANGHPELNTCSFAHGYLLQKMGIEAAFWGRDPQGYFSGGYDVYLTPRELAKFGLLYLHDGLWQGEQLVPAAWVAESTERHFPHPTRDGVFYGYNWFSRDVLGHRVSHTWGFGGQFAFVVKDLNLVMVITTDTHNSLIHEYEDGHLILQNFVIPAIKAGQ